MAYTRTLLQVRQRVLYRADIQTTSPNATTNRHQLNDLNQEINDSYRDFLTIMKTRGFDVQLVETAQANLPTVRADTNEAYSEVAWPAASAYIKRIDVLVGGTWGELTRRDWGQLRSEYRSSSGSCQRPLVWAPKSEGSVSGAVFTAGKLALAPFAPVGGKYKITYAPEFVDLTSDTDLFLFPDPNCYNYVVWDVASKVCIRDRDNKKQLDECKLKKAECGVMIGEFADEIADTGPMTMTRGPDYFT